ncbi:LysM domain-containing protein [Oenococcus oeni]
MLQISGNNVLLAGISSWISKSNVEILLTTSTSSALRSSSSTGTYTVQLSDTLSAIAAKYGTTYQNLASLNGIGSPYLIIPGEKLKINRTATTGSAVYYTIKSGDTLSEIASKYGTTYLKLASLNSIKAPYVIYVGKTIRVK